MSPDTPTAGSRAGARLSASDRARLLERARSIDWYHSMELDGELTTIGEFDLRPHVARYGLPAEMAGMRVLDVGTFNGFWAFEMERRGATVVALDLDDADSVDLPRFRKRHGSSTPLGQGFKIAHALYESKVERVISSIYEATPEELGQFDLVFCGSMLIHLKNQFLALERMLDLLRPGSLLISCEPFAVPLEFLPWPAARFRADRPGAAVFWEPATRAWRSMIHVCGFEEIHRLGKFRMRSPRGYSVAHVVHHARAPRATAAEGSA